MKKTAYIAAILSILAAAAIIRLHDVGVNPNGLFCDEAAMGYSAYSVLLTGRDEYGTMLPLYFRSFGEYKEPVYIYSAIPFIKAFGLNELSTRLPSVAYGVLSILFTWLLATRLFGRKVGLLSALLLAVSISHFHYSRIAFGAMAMHFFFVSGFYLLVRGMDDRKYLFMSAVPLSLCFYSYGVSKVFIPLFLAGFVFINRKRLLPMKRDGFIALGIFIVLSLPVAAFSIFGHGQKRFNEHSIFNEANESRVAVAEGYRENDLIPEGMKTFGPLISTHVFVKNYLHHFSPDFLFLNGDPVIRHSPLGFGMFHRFYIPLVLIGLASFMLRRGDGEKTVLWWILVSPVPDSLLGPDTITRTFVLIPAFEIMSAAGFMAIIKGLDLKALSSPKGLASTGAAGAVMLYAALNTAAFFNHYFERYPVYSAPKWEYGMKAAVQDLEKNFPGHGYFFFSGFCEPYMHVLFHLGYDPALYQKDGHIGRYIFDADALERHKGLKGLVITNYYRAGLPEPKKIIYYPDGTPAVFFLERD